jgi:N-methylhydantoinase B
MEDTSQTLEQLLPFGQPHLDLAPPQPLERTFALKEPPVELDAITYEILKHRLWYLVLTIGETLKKVSGTTVVVEGNDFSVYLTDSDGAPVFLGPYVMMHSGIADMLVANTISLNMGEDVGIYDGDMFFCNDPWLGPIHQCDCAVVSPVFIGEEIFAWTGVTLHQIDMGGVDIGGLCPNARTYYAEPSMYPAIKIVEKGRFRQDIDRMLRRNSRLPGILALDIRSMIGANEVAQKDLMELVEKYGADMVKSAMIMVQNRTSEAFKERLGTLPRGRFRGRDFLEIGGNAPELQDEIYEVQLTMTNTGDKLIFDYSGTCKQSGGFVNCGVGGLRSGTLTSFVEPLAWDLPWNAGLLANIEIISQEGTLNNPEPPAAVSDGISEGAVVTLNAATRAIILMILLHDELRQQSWCTSGGAFLGNTMGGLDQRNQIWGTLLMDTVSGIPYGANASKDGIDVAGTPGIPYSLMANVETNEFHYPLLYLYRRTAQDASGPGYNRGGSGIELCMTLHDTFYMLLLLWTHGFEFPSSLGGSGGLSGSCARAKLAMGTDIEERFSRGEWPQDIEEFDAQSLPAKSESHLGAGSVLYLSPQSTAGYGDPIKREPERVLADVIKNLVSRETALRFYGVVVEGDPPQVNEEATSRERSRVIEQRLSEGRKPSEWGELVPQDMQGSPPSSKDSLAEVGDRKAEGDIILTMGMGLRLVRKENGDMVWACFDCGNEYCAVEENPKLEAKIRVGRLNDFAGPYTASTRLDNPRFFCRHFYCPGCGLMWNEETARASDPIVHDVELDRDYLASL